MGTRPTHTLTESRRKLQGLRLARRAKLPAPPGRVVGAHPPGGQKVKDGPPPPRGVFQDEDAVKVVKVVLGDGRLLGTGRDRSGLGPARGQRGVRVRRHRKRPGSLYLKLSSLSWRWDACLAAAYQNTHIQLAKSMAVLPLSRQRLTPPCPPRRTRRAPSRPCKCPESQSSAGGSARLRAGRLTPSLWVSFLMTPSCGERMTVSIFMDSMLRHKSRQPWHVSQPGETGI